MKEGATLFIIEPEPYKLRLEQARAAEAGAQATLKQAEAECGLAPLTSRSPCWCRMPRSAATRADATCSCSTGTIRSSSARSRSAPEFGDLRVIESGLKPDDRIVVAGILRAIPGQKATEAARARFRPIVMTSLAFILGVVPLVLASGAGASARTSIGITVFTGMIASTCLAVLFVPPFFVVARHFEEWRRARTGPSPARRPVEQ